jgi:alpha-tubulin suppressor-like RCC1 family protein
MKRLLVLLSIAGLAACNQPIPTPTGPALDTGYDHACVLDSNGKAYCWGNNSEGQLGSSDLLPRSAPTPIQAPAGGTVLSFSSISAGAYFTCGIAGGTGYCWGTNGSGQFGNNSTQRSLVPTPILLPNVSFAQVSAGTNHVCAISTAGKAYCWGSGRGQRGGGQLGTGSDVSSLVPVAVEGDLVFSQISAGFDHTCGIAGGVAYCWGTGSSGQLGNDTREESLVPNAVSADPSLRFSSISAGGYHTCGISVTKVTYCWGAGSAGQLGQGGNVNGSISDALLPTPVLNPTGSVAGFTFDSVSSGDLQTCGLNSGIAYCWGNNGNGTLGNGDTSNRSIPTAVLKPIGENPKYAVVSTGQTYSCAVQVAPSKPDQIYCWGLVGSTSQTIPLKISP